jgi:hypothetical protein
METGEAVPSIPPKAMRSLEKWGATSLAQSIFVKNDNTRLRWHIWKNPDALEARFATMRSRGKK